MVARDGRLASLGSCCGGTRSAAHLLTADTDRCLAGPIDHSGSVLWGEDGRHLFIFAYADRSVRGSPPVEFERRLYVANLEHGGAHRPVLAAISSASISSTRSRSAPRAITGSAST